MYPVVAILAGISIVATAACWLFDNLTEEEKKRNKRLKDEIDELKKGLIQKIIIAIKILMK